MNKFVNLGLAGAFLLLALSSNATASAVPAHLSSLEAVAASDSNLNIPKCDFSGTIDPDNYHVSVSGIPPTVSINPGATATVRCYRDFLAGFTSDTMAANAGGIPKCEFGGSLDPESYHVSISGIPPSVSVDPGATAWIRCYRDFVNSFLASSLAADMNGPGIPKCDFGGSVDPENYHVSVSGIPPTVSINPGATAWVRCTLAYLAQTLASNSMASTGLPKCDFSGSIDPSSFYVEISHIPPKIHYDPGVDYTIRCYMDYLAQFVSAPVA